MPHTLRLSRLLSSLVAAAWLAQALAAGDADDAYVQARAALAARDYASATVQFEALVAKHPGDADYVLGLGQTHLARGDALTAITLLERARALAPEYLDVLQVLASAYLVAGRRTAAHATYQAAAQLAPDAQWTHAGLQATMPQMPLAESDAMLSTAPAPNMPQSAVSATALTFTAGTEFTLTERDETWHESAFGLDYRWKPRAHVGVRAARSQRFDRNDTLLELAGSVPINEKITIAGRAIASPSHRVRVREGGVLEASVAMPRDFVVTVGGGRMVYNEGSSDLLSTTLESYMSAFRLAYTAILVQPPRGEWTPIHRWAADWYHGAEDRVSISISNGEETDASLLGTASVFDSWGAGLNARHWLTAHFALDVSASYNGLETPRGDHLDRTTFYLGVALRP